MYEKVPQMSRGEWADVVGKIIADSLCVASVKVGPSTIRNIRIPIKPRMQRLAKRINYHIDNMIKIRSEMITPEGIKLRIFEPKNAKTLLERMKDKVFGNTHKNDIGSKNIASIASSASFKFKKPVLQHMFSRHARDFKVLENWSSAAANRFEKILEVHIDACRPIQGTYRGTQQVLHYFDEATCLNVMTDLTGNLIGGWKLSPDQVKYLLSTGAVK